MSKRKLASLLLALAATSAPALAAPKAPSPAMLAPVMAWIEAFNADRLPLPRDVFTADAVVTDQFPPYVWSGSTGVEAWSKSLEDGLRDPKLKHERVEVGTPQQFLTGGTTDRAQFVLPATLTYTYDGKPGTDRALWLFVVVKEDGVWKIAADTWTRT